MIESISTFSFVGVSLLISEILGQPVLSDMEYAFSQTVHRLISLLVFVCKIFMIFGSTSELKTLQLIDFMTLECKMSKTNICN